MTSETLLELSSAYQRSQPLLAAAELGVFAVLADGSKSTAAIADALETDPRATELLLNALVALGVLEKDGDAFGLPQALVPLLSGSDDESVLPMIRHHATCAHRWNTLAEVVRSGAPVHDETSSPRTEAELRAFISAMHVVGRDAATDVVAVIRPERFRRALDVGGGSGTYTLAMLRAAPDLRVTLFDLPRVVGMARERLRQEGVLDRVEIVDGDFYVDSLPPGHDLVLLSAIIHQNGSSQNRSLFENCLRALEPGGHLVIRDIVMDATHTRPPRGALFAINMLVATAGGGTYDFHQIRHDLESAGFVDVELLQAGTWMDGLVSAARPR
jgi:predicted O-methyltransferase YrrM